MGRCVAMPSLHEAYLEPCVYVWLFSTLGLSNIEIALGPRKAISTSVVH